MTASPSLNSFEEEAPTTIPVKSMPKMTGLVGVGVILSKGRRPMAVYKSSSVIAVA